MREPRLPHVYHIVLDGKVFCRQAHGRTDFTNDSLLGGIKVPVGLADSAADHHDALALFRIHALGEFGETGHAFLLAKIEVEFVLSGAMFEFLLHIVKVKAIEHFARLGIAKDLLLFTGGDDTIGLSDDDGSRHGGLKKSLVLVLANEFGGLAYNVVEKIFQHESVLLVSKRFIAVENETTVLLAVSRQY